MFGLFNKVCLREFGLQFSLFQILTFFVKLRLTLCQLELSMTELMEKCDHTICPVLSILFKYELAYQAGKIYL